MQLWVQVQPMEKEASDLTVEVSPDASAQSLVDALAHHLDADGSGHAALYSPRSGAWIHGERAVSSFDLRVGDQLILSPEGQRETRERQATPEEAPFRVAVVGGRLAGTRIALASGEHILGRGAGATVMIDDASLAEEQIRIRVAADGVHLSRAADVPETVVDDEPLDGERSVDPGQVVRAGRTLLVFERREPREPPPTGRDGVVPFNRPPQVRPRLTPQRLEAPEPPTETQRMRIPLPAMVLPLFAGVGLWLFTKNPTSLVFAALSPVMAGWNYVADRRRGKSTYGRRTQDFRQKLDELKQSLAAARTAELQARRRLAPNAAELVERARSCRPELWERRPEDDGFLGLRLGTADSPAVVEVDIPRRGDDELVAEIDELVQPYRTVKDVPVVLPLGVLGAAGVSGLANRVAAHGRWLVFQAATLHSPRDLVLCGAFARERLDDWDWLKWLPHTRAGGSPLETHLASDAITARTLLEELSKLLEERRSQRAQSAARSRQLPVVLLLLDEGIAPERALIGPIMAEGADHGIVVLWLGSDVRALPGECRAVVELDGEGALKLTDTQRGEVVENVTADELTLKLARDAAVALASVVDVSATEGRGRLPRQVSLVELLGFEEVSSSTVAGRWRTYDGRRSALLGAAADGPFEVDLVLDGPHALIGGTTGSGKSELLQTLVSSLAATAPPDRLNFLLVDYKGGAAFKECVALPHTVGFVTDLDAHLTNRARISLDAELKRREELLRRAGAKDLAEMERRDPGAAPPSLVIVVDEFATLANEIPEFVEGVVDVAQRGRTLGLHLVLATQRPRGVDHRQHPREHEPPYRDADGGRHREPGRHRSSGGGDDSTLAPRPRICGHRARRADGVPGRVRRRPFGGGRNRRASHRRRLPFRGHAAGARGP